MIRMYTMYNARLRNEHMTRADYSIYVDLLYLIYYQTENVRLVCVCRAGNTHTYSRQ